MFVNLWKKKHQQDSLRYAQTQTWGDWAIDYTKFTFILDPLKFLQPANQEVQTWGVYKLAPVNELQNGLEAQCCNNPGKPSC